MEGVIANASVKRFRSYLVMKIVAGFEMRRQ